MYIYMYVYTFTHIHIDIYNSLKTWTFTFKVYLKLGHSVSCLCTHQQVIHIKVTYWLNEWNGGRDNRIKTGEGVKILLLILEELVCESWGGKKSPVFQQRLVSVSAFWNNFVAFVESFSRVGCGDKCFFKETQVTHPYFPAVGRGQPEDWPIGWMLNLFTFQVPNKYIYIRTYILICVFIRRRPEIS